MPRKHLKELYEICQTHRLKLSSTDLIRIVCPQCGVEDVCPSVLAEEYETRHHDEMPTPHRPEVNRQSPSRPFSVQLAEYYQEIFQANA
jgi:hypothetical protein